MSESPEEKTKRMFCNHMRSNEWNYQYSFFYENWKDIKETIAHSRDLKTFMRRSFREQAFLYRLCVNYYGGFVAEYNARKKLSLPYHTFITNEKIDMADIEARLKKQPLPFRVSSRKIREDKITSYVNSVKSQNPHDIRKAVNKLFENQIDDKQKIRRFDLLGKKYLKPLA